MCIELVMPSNHFILCRPLVFLPSIFPSIRVFSNESVLYIRWPKYWSFSFSISPSNDLMLCLFLLLLLSIFSSIRIFFNALALLIRWPKYWSFIFSISPSNEYSGLIPLGLTSLISLQSKGLSRVFSITTVRKHQFFSTQPSVWSKSHICT